MSKLILFLTGTKIKSNSEIVIYPSGLEISTYTGYWIVPFVVESQVFNKPQVGFEIPKELQPHFQKLNTMLRNRLQELFPGYRVEPSFRYDDRLFLNLIETHGKCPRLILETDYGSNEIFGLDNIKKMIHHRPMCVILTLEFLFITVKDKSIYFTPSLKGIFQCVM